MQIEELDWITVLVWFATRPREGKKNDNFTRAMLTGGSPQRLRELQTIEALFAC